MIYIYIYCTVDQLPVGSFTTPYCSETTRFTHPTKMPCRRHRSHPSLPSQSHRKNSCRDSFDAVPVLSAKQPGCPEENDLDVESRDERSRQGFKYTTWF